MTDACDCLEERGPAFPCEKHLDSRQEAQGGFHEGLDGSAERDDLLAAIVTISLGTPGHAAAARLPVEREMTACADAGRCPQVMREPAHVSGDVSPAAIQILSASANVLRRERWRGHDRSMSKCDAAAE